ncbi:MAG: hypothetical protein GYB33_19445 [Gammaproteobacteria bacterium]|uniref:hypothetical protein n=1 Tax=Pseudomaricurvus alcaniphilus TaxID=1166482 RepID=UPI00140A1B02|nr:hypothetical protein [Pseudomaricurvus alcaniphilus]MBR9912521.1 hypothetical protein [Gammaproteobacteria bacterium]NHN36302.1 hypothetical protein [Pseudomaricurvus alcaniphilus]
MQKLLLAIGLAVGLVTGAQAATVGTMKVYTGNYGGVITVQKNVSGQREAGFRSSGLVTVSDVAVRLVRDVDPADALSNDTTAEELGSMELDDASRDADGAISYRSSGKVRFRGQHIVDSDSAASRLELNGGFRKLSPLHHSLRLIKVAGEVINGEVVLSGEVVINGEKMDINAAPELVQRFVLRLLWFIRHQ